MSDTVPLLDGVLHVSESFYQSTTTSLSTLQSTNSDTANTIEDDGIQGLHPPSSKQTGRLTPKKNPLTAAIVLDHKDNDSNEHEDHDGNGDNEDAARY